MIGPREHSQKCVTDGRTSFMTTDGVSPPGNVSERGLLYKNPVGSVSGLVRTSVCFNPVGYFPKFPSTTLAI